MEVQASGSRKHGAEVEQQLLEEEKMKRKLQKVQQRRDHYARLYYQAIVELDATRLALSRAMTQITELQAQVTRQSYRKPVGSNTTSPDSGASLSPAIIIDPLSRQQRSEGPAFIQQGNGDHTYEEMWMNSHEPPAPLRAPTGCQTSPVISYRRRSLTLSQQDPLPIHPTFNGVTGSRYVALSQDYSVSEPKKFERALSMPTKIRRPFQMNSSSAEMTDSVINGQQHQHLSAFKKLSPPVEGNPPQRQTIACANSMDHNRSMHSRGELQLNSLSQNELLSLCSQLSSLTCSIKKLELSNCGLGKLQNMKLFCDHLAKNKSIVVLSLPQNGISIESLSLLLDSLQHCPNIKELLLRHNLIGQECVGKIKEFLECSTVDALVLTGNAIEKHSHLLGGALPKDFTMELPTQRRETRSVESQDSGVHHTDPSDNEPNSQHTFPMQSAFKQLCIQ